MGLGGRRRGSLSGFSHLRVPREPEGRSRGPVLGILSDPLGGERGGQDAAFLQTVEAFWTSLVQVCFRQTLL